MSGSSPFDLTDANVVMALVIVVFVAALIGCIFCICWKRQIDRRLTNLGLTHDDIQRSIDRSERERVHLSVAEADSSSCGWCRYWWGDQTYQNNNDEIMTAQSRKSQLEMSRDEMEESNDVLCNLETLPASSQGTRSGSICSTSIKAQYLRDSPKLSRSSISRDTMDRRGSISTGGRRISHDPFTLCQDLQVLETRRRSEAFQTRRKSEQFQMSSTGRRKSSVFGPLLEQRDNERKSFSMEQM